MSGLAVALALLVLTVGPMSTVASAQRPATLFGRVTDSATAPIAGAVVEVVGTKWRVASWADGSFVVALPRGAWAVRIARIGWVPETLTVEIADGQYAHRIDVVLRRAIPTLPQVVVAVDARAPPLAQGITREATRSIPPLGEPDVFRAATLLPGVSQPNDLKGRIHLAGGTSDETGVRLDGHPLHEPFHLLGVLGAFNVAALERADVLIHHLPASAPGWQSGVIDLHTRLQVPRASTELSVSIISAGATATRAELPGGLDALASARITYLDLVLDELRGRVSTEGATLPGFWDALVRVGRSLESGWRAEAIGFATRDQLRSSPRNPAEIEPLTWGEQLAGVRLERERGAWRIRARASHSTAVVRSHREFPDVTERLANHRAWSAIGLEATRAARRWTVSAGVAFDHRAHEYAWEGFGTRLSFLSPRSPPDWSAAETQRTVAAFVGGTRDIGAHWDATAGVRVSTVAGETYVAPRLALTWEAGPSLVIEGSLDRRHQFDAQVEEPEEGSVTVPVLFLERPRVADVAAIGATWRPQRNPIGSGLAVRAHLFHKRYRDRPALAAWGSSSAGAPAGPPSFDRVPGRAYGATVGWQWSGGAGVLLQGSYAFLRSLETIGGTEMPTAWDAPHQATLLATARLPWRWTLATVLHARDGVAVTPLDARILAPQWGYGPRLSPRHLPADIRSARVPPYYRLDLALRRSWVGWGAEWTLSLQALNVSYRRNQMDYDWYRYFCVRQGGCAGVTTGREGMPIVPSIGLEVTW